MSSTSLHLALIRELGPAGVHRRSSRPVTALAALRMDCSCNPRTGYT